jgi:hypothetical protein
MRRTIKAIRDREELRLGTTERLNFLVEFDGSDEPRWISLEQLIEECGIDHASDFVMQHQLEHGIEPPPVSRIIGKSNTLRLFFLCVTP